jgi:hypothetical protein
MQWAITDSNRGLSACKADTLTAELIALAPQPGFEPGTNRLTVDGSTAELLWNIGSYWTYTSSKGIVCLSRFFDLTPFGVFLCYLHNDYQERNTGFEPVTFSLEG